MIPSTRRPVPIATLNITNLVDVCLVLLVIFMMVAPAISMGIKVDLPKAAATTKPMEASKAILISIGKDGEMSVQNSRISSIDALTVLLKKEILSKPDWPVLVKCDRTQSVDMLYQIMSAAQSCMPEGGTVGLLGNTSTAEKKPDAPKTGDNPAGEEKTNP